MINWKIALFFLLLLVGNEIAAQTGSGQILQAREFRFRDIDGKILNKHNYNEGGYLINIIENNHPEGKRRDFSPNGVILYETQVTRYYGDYNHVQAENLVIEFVHLIDTMRIEVNRISGGHFILKDIIFQKGNYTISPTKENSKKTGKDNLFTTEMKIDNWQEYLKD